VPNLISDPTVHSVKTLRLNFRGAEQQTDPSTNPTSPQTAALPWQNWVQPLQAVPQVLQQHANPNQIAQDLRVMNAYGGGEILSLLPGTVAVSSVLGPSYIGLDVYNQARQAYLSNANLEQQQRIKETAIKTGDVALVHGLASVGIPLLLAKQVSRRVHQLLDKPKTPPLLARHPKIIVSAAMFGLMLVLAKPIQLFTNFVLDWTYRPLLERKRREEVRKIWQIQMDRQLQWFQTQSLLNRWRNPTASAPVNTSSPTLDTTV
jgi:hypothetical protein